MYKNVCVCMCPRTYVRAYLYVNVCITSSMYARANWSTSIYLSSHFQTVRYRVRSHSVYLVELSNFVVLRRSNVYDIKPDSTQSANHTLEETVLPVIQINCAIYTKYLLNSFFLNITSRFNVFGIITQ